MCVTANGILSQFLWLRGIPVEAQSLTHWKVKVKVAQLSRTLCDPMDCTVFSGVGRLFLLQRIFSTEGSNPGLPYCRQILYQLSHKESPLTT